MLEEFEMGIVSISGSLTLPSVILLVLWKNFRNKCISYCIKKYCIIGSYCIYLPNEIISDLNRNKSNEITGKVTFIQGDYMGANAIQ